MFSSAAGPFQRGYVSSSTQTPFQRLKLVCVELLSLTGRTTGAAQTQQVVACLRRLKTTLRALLSEHNTAFAADTNALQDVKVSVSTSKLVPHNSITEPALPASLINYIFYPLSELISSAPKGITSLPDSIAEVTLNVLALLCSQWWAAWAEVSGETAKKQWQVWCDLVILSSSVLGSPASKDDDRGSAKARVASDEVKLSAMCVLSELLSPRFTAPQRSSAVSKPKETEWEWDGVSDLPSLDEAETLTNSSSISDRTGNENVPASTHLTLVFPTPEHLSFAATERVAKGAISFVLSSSFSIAESSQECTEARMSAIGVARNALLLWIGGACPLPTHQGNSEGLDIPPLLCIQLPQQASTSATPSEESVQKAVSQRLRPLLPGITSSLTRLATSRMKSRSDGVKQKSTPSGVAAGAVELLGDLFRATLSDECLSETIAEKLPLSRTHVGAQASSTSIKVTDLWDFADLSTEVEQTSGSNSISSDGKDAPMPDESEPARKDAQWALSTLAQVHLALKTFSPLTQPSLPGTSLPSTVHSSVQKAILHLAVVLLSECSDSFTWLDQQLEAMARLDATTTNTAADASGSSINTLLTWIVDLASDHNSESVAKSARTAFDALQNSSSGNTSLGSRLGDGSALWPVLTQALNSFPPAIVAHDDATVSRLALRVSTVLKLLPQGAKQTSTGLAGIAKLVQDIQQASVRLIRPLKVEQLNHVGEAGEMGSTTWRLQPVFAGLEASTSKQLSQIFYDFGRSLALSLVQELKLGRSKGDAGEVFSMITFLIERAARLRSIRLESARGVDDGVDQDGTRRNESLTSLVVAADMLRGVSSCLDNMELGFKFAELGLGGAQASKQASKMAHKLGKKVFGLVMDMLDGDAEEAITTRAHSEGHRKAPEGQTEQGGDNSNHDLSLKNPSSNPNTLTERIKGLSLAPTDISSSTPARHGPVLDLAFVCSADLTKSNPSKPSTALTIQHRYKQAERTLDLSNAVLFSLLSSASKLLGQSFRTLLLRGSYPLISGMSASSEVVRVASGAAMRDVAFNTAYGDVKNCLMDHADYVLGSACQRLVSGLDEELRAIAFGETSHTGGTIAAVVRGTGSSREGTMVVLPLVSAQRAPFVLVEMIRVLGSEIVPMVEDAIDEILDALDRFHEHPTICDGLLAVLDSILETMASEQASKIPNPKVNLPSSGTSEVKRTEVEDFAAWLAARKQEQPAFDAAPEADTDVKSDKQKKEEEEEKPSKSQQVATQILTKATPFLTHPSPIFRTRVLYLLRHGIETLAPQARTAELLPIINSAWPFIMTRLGTSYSISTPSKGGSKMEPIIDLNPAAIGAGGRKEDEKWYKKMEAAFVERDPEVWVAASRVVESAVKWVPDFVGKRVLEEAWPRFEVLLRMLRWRFDPRMSRGNGGLAQNSANTSLIDDALKGSESKALLNSETTSSDGPIRALISADLRRNPAFRNTTSQHVHIDPPFILPSASSVPAQLTLCIVAVLTTVVRHLNTRMPDQAAWTITTHPYLLDLLDSRQPPAILHAAEGLYVELSRRNAEATLWAIRTAFPKASEAALATPCFMLHAGANVHTETLHHIAESFTAF